MKSSGHDEPRSGGYSEKDQGSPESSKAISNRGTEKGKQRRHIDHRSSFQRVKRSS